MTIRLLAGATLALGAFSSAATAAPANLTFDVTARVFYKDGASAPAPAQTLNARVWLSGKRARLDTTLSGRPLRLLFSPPYAYRLLPTARIGQRYKASNLPPLAGLMPGAGGVVPDPKAIRAALVKGGAQKTGTTTVAGVPVDVYTTSKFRGRADRVKALLRRSDGLPVRVEVDSKNFQAVASWRGYARPSTLDASLFAVPAGFKIREGAPSNAL